MRLSNGKRWGEWAGYVRLFNGNNGEWLAKMVVTETSTPQKRRRRQNKSNADNTILECLQQTKLQPSERLSSVHLHMGRLKKQRRKWVLEKITELGISSIEVVDTEYATTTDAWEFEKHCIQVIEAAEQCERLTIPKLSQAPIAWSDLITSIKESKSDQHWLVCRERCPELTEPILFALREINENRKGDDLQRNIHILVGPEGGWSPGELEELSFLREAEKNLRFVSLGPLVLRAETAAISAVAATVLSGDQID
jgi:16S rRNA (uracil1498-N3)-methyltransferase